MSESRKSLRKSATFKSQLEGIMVSSVYQILVSTFRDIPDVECSPAEGIMNILDDPTVLIAIVIGPYAEGHITYKGEWITSAQRMSCDVTNDLSADTDDFIGLRH